MTNLQSLSVFVTERLTLAAQEIFKAVEVTVTEYHEEISRSRQENEALKRRLLEAGIDFYAELQPGLPVLHENEASVGLPACGEQWPQQSEEIQVKLELSAAQEGSQNSQPPLTMDKSISPNLCLQNEQQMEEMLHVPTSESSMDTLLHAGPYMQIKEEPGEPVHDLRSETFFEPQTSISAEPSTAIASSHASGLQDELDSHRLSSMHKAIRSKMAKNNSIEDILEVIWDGESSDIEQLGEDEEEEEKWTHAVMSTDGSSDSSDGEDLQDENMDQTSIEGEYPTVTQNITKQSVSGQVQSTVHQWKKKPFETPAVEFDKCAEEDTEDRLGWTPYMYFQNFVTEEMLQEIAEQTNLYSVKKQGRSVNTSAEEIEQILGMYMHMGLVQMPSVRAYWEMETEHAAVSDVMPRDRFLKLLRLIHFQDSFTVPDDAKKDKLWKLRPWLQKLRRQFLCIPPEECHVVDKIIVPFRDKSHQRFCTSSKPHKWGFKMWGRAGQSGFLYDFDICQEAESPDQVKSNVGASGDILLKMTSTLPAGRNHKVFADNNFTSIPLVEQLKERGIYYVGTVEMNRVKNCNMEDEKDLKTRGRGSLDFRVNQDNTIIVRWCDNKAVNLLSSFVGIEPLVYVRRLDKKFKTHVMVPRPAIVETYNKVMGEVELLDMLTALYKFNFRSRRWYMYIWWHTVTLALVNAWSLYRRDQRKLYPWKKPMALRRFQAAVGTYLTTAGIGKIKYGRPLSSPEATPPPPRKRTSSSVPFEVRNDGFDHFPTLETRQRCKHCTGNHFTRVYCRKCKVHLCLNKGRNCFLAYHNEK